MGFKQSLKKNKVVHMVSRIAASPVFFLQYMKSEWEARLRKRGKIYFEYMWIKNLRNSHLGERCFVVATGPSLTMEDLDLIKNEFCFGMNSCALALDKTQWRPDVYAIQDEYIYETLNEVLSEIGEDNLKDVWVGNNIASLFDVPKRFKQYSLHYLDNKFFHFKGYGTFKFSDDCYSCVYSNYSIVFAILQMACYMGFKEIYLLGCDCNYTQKKNHFIDYDYKDPRIAVSGDSLIQGHYEFKKFADAMGVKVVNCTRGGMLKVYPRKKLEDVLVG